MVRALLWRGAMLNHSCDPNATFALDDGAIVFRAVCPIPAGAEICIDYLGRAAPTAERRARLRETKLFDCACARCRAPELMRAVLCPHGVSCPRPERSWTCCDAGAREAAGPERDHFEARAVPPHTRFPFELSKVRSRSGTWSFLVGFQVCSRLYERLFLASKCSVESVCREQVFRLLQISAFLIAAIRFHQYLNIR